MDEKAPVARLIRGGGRAVRPAPAARPAPPGPEAPNVRIVRAPGATRTIVAFAGLGQLVGGMTPFNFLHSLEGIDANVVFVRDPRRTWYNGPIADLGRSAGEIAGRIGDLAAEAGGGPLYLLGTSSGGYAALAFAPPLAARRVLAFAPQTTIDPSLLRSIGETRWLKMLDRRRPTDLLDVVPALEAAPPPGGCDIIVGRRVPHDLVYAKRLAHIPGVAIHIVRGGHNTAMHLRERGALARVLRAFVDDAPLALGEVLYPGG